MSFKFGAFSGAGSSSSTGASGGLYAGIALDGKQPVEPIPTPEATAPVMPAEEPSAPNESKPDESKDKEKGAWSASLRFAPVIRKPASKPSGFRAAPVSFPSTSAAAPKPSAFASLGDDEEDDALPVAPPPGKGLHIPGRAKAALNAPQKKEAIPQQYSVFAKSGGFLAAHAPERHPANFSAASSAPSAPPPSASASASTVAPGKVDSGIPGLQHSLPALLANTTTLGSLASSASAYPTSRTLRRKLDNPPPLTLPESENQPIPRATGGAFGRFGGLATGDSGDVNGFAQTEEGKKLAQKASKGKKKKGKGKQKEIDPAVFFAEDYDPSRPNDYAEWIAFLKSRRQARREAARREREERRKEEEGISEYSEDYSDDSRESRFFAPPADYDAPPQPSREAPTGTPPPPAAATFVAPRAETGDEAYARRLALSQGRQPPSASGPVAQPAPRPGAAESGEEAYLRRLAMSSMQNKAPQPAITPAPPPSFVGPSVPYANKTDDLPPPPPSFVGPTKPTESIPPPPPSFVTATASSDEVPPPPPSFVSASVPVDDKGPPSPPVDMAEDDDDEVPYIEAPPPAPPAGHASMIADAQARARAIAEKLGKLKAPAPPDVAPPPPPGPPTGDFPPPPPPSAEAGPSSVSMTNPAIQEAQARARAIAARLASLGGEAAAASAEAAKVAEQQPNKAPGQADFARRLMDKYGWKEGQGLGASESGRTSILTVETNTPSHPSKRKKGQQEDENQQPQAKRGTMASGVGKGRGMVVDESRAEREKEEKEKYGEPTRVVMLSNMVGPNEVDDDLADEIAEEARKLGIVERCFVRLLQRPCEEHEAVRVFILFSGLVGAWKAVKAFDGRFFGGRDVRARFFPENAFQLGNFDA